MTSAFRVFACTDRCPAPDAAVCESRDFWPDCRA